MSLPRPIDPGVTYLLTRRCLLRTYLLRPSKELNQIFLYCLAVAAEKYGIEIHAYCVMSNHYHIIATDPHAQLPAFMHWLNEFVAKTVNTLLGRKEVVWSQGPYSAVRLEQAEDVLDKMVYVNVNPVKARLVSDARAWPGLNSLPEDLDGRVVSASRPGLFFRKKGVLPEKAELKLRIPPALAHIPPGELIARLRSRIEQRQEDIQREARRMGQPFLGRRGVLDQSPFAASTSQERRERTHPRVACKDAVRRKEVLMRIRNFVRAYRKAWERFCNAATDVVFPSGTYLLRLRYGVPCDPGY